MADDVPREATEPVPVVVELDHAGEDAFVEAFADQVDEGEMTLTTPDLQEAGSVVRFEIRIASGVSVMTGDALVKWTRPAGDPAGPPAMGLEFLTVDDPTQAVIDKMLVVRARREAQAGPPPGYAADVDRPLVDRPVVNRPVKGPVDFFDDVDLSSVEQEIEEERSELELGPSTVYLQPPESVLDEGPIIGIDLGTTNSCVSFYVEGRPWVLKSKKGYNTIPSIVALTGDGKLLLAHAAKAQMLTNPTQTISGAKRLVGRQFDSPIVQEVRARLPYTITADSQGNAAVLLGEDVLSLEEVQGLILREAKEIAEGHLGQTVNRAVVTVPAYYSDSQRQAVREAGRLAGLRVHRILNEPTAAALAYGLDKGLQKTVLVYDLGGGTFDATAMAIDGNVFEVLATAGDTFLGGVDFDNQIIEHLLLDFQERTNQPFPTDAVSLSRVTEAAEEAKKALSERESFEVNIPCFTTNASGNPVDLKCTLTREELTVLHRPLVARSLDVVHDVLLDAHLKASDIDDIILVGGQSRSPLVTQCLKDMFGWDPQSGVHPDEAVALGAALLAGTEDRIDSVVLIDVLPMTIGIGLPGGRFKRIIERNSALPLSKSYGIRTSRDDQEFLEVAVYQGEDDNVAGNDFLGTLRLDDLPKGPRGSVSIVVTFELGQECVLAVEAVEQTTGKAVRSSLATRATSDQILKLLKVDQAAVDEAQARQTRVLEEEGSSFWKAFRKKKDAEPTE